MKDVDIGRKPVYWSGGAAIDLLLPGGGDDGCAFGITPDGSMIVGFDDGNNGREAFSWDTETGIQGLGDLSGGEFFSLAYAVSADGSSVVGRAAGEPIPASALSTGWEAFRWENGVMVGLGALGTSPASPRSTAFDVSADGSLIVGQAIGDGQWEAFLWDARNGMRSVEQLLLDYGISTGGWDLEHATGISDDGLTIVGYGTNPTGKIEAWIATVPEPSTALLLATGLAELAAAGQQRNERR